MNWTNSSTLQYQVTGKSSTNTTVWASFDNWIEASNYAQQLTSEIEGISFHVNDIKPPTDEEVMEYFSHLDFGVA